MTPNDRVERPATPPFHPGERAIQCEHGVATLSHVQALIFPYYTANTARGDTLNTYLSIVNHTAQAKALRVRFREGRAAQSTLEFNLRSPNDVWTGAVVPAGETKRSH